MRRLFGYVEHFYYPQESTEIWIECEKSKYRILLMSSTYGLPMPIRELLQDARVVPLFSRRGNYRIISTDLSKLAQLLISLSNTNEFRPSNKFKTIFKEFNDDELDNEYMLAELQQ